MADNMNPETTAPAAGAVTVPGTPVVLASSTLYEDDRALDVLGYLRTLGRFKWVSLAVAVVVLLAGLAYAFTRPSTFTAETTVLLVPAKVDTEAQATQQAAMLPYVTRSYSQMVTTPLVLGPVMSKLDLKDKPNYKMSDLRKQIAVGYPSGSLIIRIVVTSPNEAEAIKLSNLVADEYVKAVPSFAPVAGENITLGAKVISRPEGPLDPSASLSTELAGLALVAALAAGFLTAVALDVLGRLRRPTTAPAAAAS